MCATTAADAVPSSPPWTLCTVAAVQFRFADTGARESCQWPHHRVYGLTSAAGAGVSEWWHTVTCRWPAAVTASAPSPPLVLLPRVILPGRPGSYDIGRWSSAALYGWMGGGWGVTASASTIRCSARGGAALVSPVELTGGGVRGCASPDATASHLALGPPLFDVPLPGLA